MAYKALYRTYRPATFDEVAGQKTIIQTFKNAIKEDKIAHAYLFAGPRGTGKTSMARLFAKALNCTSYHDGPCNECENCKAINEGSYPDVIELDAASNNGVEQIRDLIEKVKYAPIEGNYKVYIIDEVHMMSTQAFNALLKTLEEPPENVIFILATTEPHKVLPTVLSRCQRFDFGRISSKDIEKRLSVIAEREDVVYDDGVLELITELADGGMRDALGILDQTISYAGKAITLDDVRSVYGIVSNSEKISFIDLALRERYDELLRKVDEYDNKGIDFSRLTNELVDVLKEAIIYKTSYSFTGLRYINEDNASVFERVSNFKLFEMIDVLVEALASYKKAASVRTLFEIACLKICNLKEQGNVIEKVIYREPEVVKEKIKTKEEPKNMPASVSCETKEEEIEEEPAQEESEETLDEEEQASTQETYEEEVSKEENPLEEVSGEEESEKVEEPEEEVEVEEFSRKPTEEELLNVLVQATKDARVYAQQKWVLLPKYLNSEATAKICSIVLDGAPLAACDKALIIGYKSEAFLNRVYEDNNYREINNFMRALYNSDITCYCLTVSEFNALKDKYMTLRQLGRLPSPTPIVIKSVSKVAPIKEKKDNNQEYAQNLFGNDLVVKEG